jgi:L-rhamnose mutarotase
MLTVKQIFKRLREALLLLTILLAGRGVRRISPLEVEGMRRFGMVIRLKPGNAEAYRRYHADVWPEVLEKIRDCNISNYSIYFKDDFLFSYFEYLGDDLKSDLGRMAAHPKTQEWWTVMKPMQDPLTTRNEGDWWAEMEEVFHMD